MGTTTEGAETLRRKGPHLPTERFAQARFERAIELGQLEDLTRAGSSGHRPRYVVTYMNSQTGGRIRSATIVSVTNRSRRPNRVTVAYYKGFTDDLSPVGQTTFSLPPDFTVDFGSRDLPSELTVVNAIANPQLTWDEGRAIVSSLEPEIAVSARVYYTRGDDDRDLVAITDSKVVRYDRGNAGD